MKSKYYFFKQRVKKLRYSGKTFGEIKKILKIHISKSTLSYWCQGIKTPDGFNLRVQKITFDNLENARRIAVKVNKIRREKYLKSVRNRIIHLKNQLKNRDVAKIALSMLYLGEGGKNQRDVRFGNSDPGTIRLFLKLLRFCYTIDERKFRCTILCRADQDTTYLEKFWSKITKIPLRNFYKSRIDPRTIGKPTRDKNYKGVCNINYFLADIYYELMQAIDVLKH